MSLSQNSISAPISSKALWQGDLTLARDFTFAGHLQGNLKVRGELIVVAGARLDGNMESHSLRIEPGAKISGRVEVKRVAPLKREFFKLRLF